MSIRNSIAGLVLCLLAACDPGSQTRLDKETFEAEQRWREPRRLKEGEVFEAALRQGAAVAGRLNRQVQAGSDCCPTLPKALQDSLQQQELQLSCFSIEGEVPATAMQQEREILDAYQYSLEQNLPLEANLQPLGKEAFLYTAPLTPSDSSRQPCAVWSIRLLRRQVIKNL